MCVAAYKYRNVQYSGMCGPDRRAFAAAVVYALHMCVAVSVLIDVCCELAGSLWSVCIVYTLCVLYTFTVGTVADESTAARVICRRATHISIYFIIHSMELCVCVCVCTVRVLVLSTSAHLRRS